MKRRRYLAALAALVVAAVSVAGCVSMPTGGPVLSYPVTQGPDGQNQPYVQIVPQPPGAGWLPTQIVLGFLIASASFGDYGQVALQYLTPQERKSWTRNPPVSAIVYKNGPDVGRVTYSGPRPSPSPSPSPSPTVQKQAKSQVKNQTATVQITGTVQASLKGYGSYSVPSASGANAASAVKPEFALVNVGGQWRIQSAPDELLLTSDSFANDYQLRNLYFLDPTSKFLVPDPVYVPLRSKPEDLMNGLVHDLITPPADWLSGGATKTAFPPATKIIDATIDGVTAIVNLTGAITKASPAMRQQVSAQLLWTLSGAAQNGSTGQAVQSVEVEVNGKPWTLPGNQESSVQRTSKIIPPSGASPAFYYVTSSGYLTSRAGTTGKAVSLAKIGTRYSQIAVSPDGRYLAALRGSTLYTGLVDGTLVRRGSGYVSLSWDVNDNLWASAGNQIVMFRSLPRERLPLGQMVAVDVVNSFGIESVPFTALQVAPDGVRVAIVIGGNVLTFGAISGQLGASPQIKLSLAQLSPVAPATEFTGVTWYGPDDVITLAEESGPAATESGPAVTEYPVNGGGTPTSIPAYFSMKTVTASWGQSLIAALPKGHMVADASLTGSWMQIGNGSAPSYPG